MPKLKVDLHTHTREDPKDIVHYDACTLIRKAARLGFDAIAITNHDTVTENTEVLGCAREHGVLLIPGMEATLSRRHVVILNPALPTNRPERRLEDIADLVTAQSLVMAPHPFFPQTKSLKNRLSDNIDLFDAIEFSHFYTVRLNFNKRAVETARTHGLPLVGTSDCHTLWEFGTTYSYVEADRSADSIIEAVKQGKVEVVTSPLKPWQMAYILTKLLEVKLFHFLAGLKPRIPRARASGNGSPHK
jgi:predicted metal-dependent phosphoesterase TrpH